MKGRESRRPPTPHQEVKRRSQDSPSTPEVKKLRVLVCGGRTFTDRKLIFDTLDELHRSRGVALLIHGDARGADTIGDEWALKRNVTRLAFVPDWRLYGPAGGPQRNAAMLREGKPDLVLAFPGGPGTDNCCRQAKALGITVRRVEARPDADDPQLFPPV